MSFQVANEIDNKYASVLADTIAKMTQKGKGLLAADESTGTIEKRFKGVNIPNTEENRRRYRELLFSISKEASQYVSGVIMYHETLYQKTAAGEPFVKVLADHGIVPGIKVDTGLVTIPGTEDTVTEGMDGLAKRCQQYYEQGARFAKWRAAYTINVAKKQPSQLAIDLNAELLARYAAICQQSGLVPIVEPEVLVMEGDHDMQTSFQITEKILARVYKALSDHGVVLEHTILKPNMILPGDKHAKKATSEEIAEATVKCLRRVVPPAVPAIMFLSGGQTEEEAAVNLSNINKSKAIKPWELSFSYGRALQNSAIKTWKGEEANKEAGQKAYLEKAKNCYLAALGKL